MLSDHAWPAHLRATSHDRDLRRVVTGDGTYRVVSWVVLDGERIVLECGGHSTEHACARMRELVGLLASDPEGWCRRYL